MLAQAILFRGAGLEAVWPQLAALAVIGSVFFVIALRRFRAFLA
jgi:ABC-2 type transport system permease protein